ncbi:Xaa-Pro aminopeptidase [Amycolatopsis sulphurea]|uniref:Xaa-Pro aminopeptidase n=1 Tax=Amycolatopsis sulphurea TaxID=76022 RepID=A0A2A9FAB1_9PSEU|nr:aminopeptidase P N-terminal domain-containing protein [Amycolatopsis sulphurea]PFG47893.1 Xaa-Pro aminopeptidase [Amycolatopsis sulphurea]
MSDSVRPESVDPDWDHLDRLIAEAGRSGNIGREFLHAMTEGWQASSFDDSEWTGTAPRRARRDRVAAELRGTTVLVPVGVLVRRTNDLHYPFRPGTDHMWLAGPTDAGAVLVLSAEGDWTLYVDQRPPLGDPMALLDIARGAIWDGPPVPSEVLSKRLGLDVRPIDELERRVAGLSARAVRGLDPRVDALSVDDDGELERHFARLRLIKDEYEIAQLQDAVDAAVHGFEAVATERRQLLQHGEAYVEGLFALHARLRGRGFSYTPVVGAGVHATVLHWFGNDGRIAEGDLLLLDAGVEGAELYSSDVTRTFPVSGRFSAVQRDVYDIVQAAHAAALAAVRPGAPYAAAGEAARAVLADGLRGLGVLPHPALAHLPDTEAARRWSPHGVGHMLGADVHDAGVIAAEYAAGTYQAGHCLTIEPGLYFSPYDQWAPEHLRGVGVRIEDDVVVTADGVEVLSAALPTKAGEVESWLEDR